MIIAETKTLRREKNIPVKTAAEKIRLPFGYEADRLSELRLRAGRRAVAVRGDGCMAECSEPLSNIDIEECFRELCQNSVHSYRREISEGFITLSGGHRAGFCGTFTEEGNGAGFTLKEISSINIRFARQIIGCAEELYREIFSDGLKSMLLI